MQKGNLITPQSQKINILPWRKRVKKLGTIIQINLFLYNFKKVLENIRKKMLSTFLCEIQITTQTNVTSSKNSKKYLETFLKVRNRFPMNSLKKQYLKISSSSTFHLIFCALIWFDAISKSLITEKSWTGAVLPPRLKLSPQSLQNLPRRLTLSHLSTISRFEI